MATAYEEMVGRLAKNPEVIASELDANRINMLLRLAASVFKVGHCADKVKRHIIYNGTEPELPLTRDAPYSMEYLETVLKNITPHKAHILHMCLGKFTEACELYEAACKYALSPADSGLDIENVQEELGDDQFYTTGLRIAVGLTAEEIEQANMTKLSSKEKGRFADGYSDNAAIARADKQ